MTFSSTTKTSRGNNSVYNFNSLLIVRVCVCVCAHYCDYHVYITRTFSNKIHHFDPGVRYSFAAFIIQVWCSRLTSCISKEEVNRREQMSQYLRSHNKVSVRCRILWLAHAGVCCTQSFALQLCVVDEQQMLLAFRQAKCYCLLVLRM